jgi:hypothetical protein
VRSPDLLLSPVAEEYKVSTLRKLNVMELMSQKNNVYESNLGEVDDPMIYAQPNGKVVKALQTSNSRQELVKNLPNDF